MTRATAYVSTITAPGMTRFAIKLGGAIIAVIDIPSGPSANEQTARWLAHRWLTGDALPDSVKLWSTPATERPS